jgi:hypothetical protein
VETSIGNTLREARNRRKLEISEVEAAIKIRARYLRAMENEEWGILPGGAYTRGFIRTYALYLGLDGERLADEYRQASGAPAVEQGARLEPVSRPRRSATSWLPAWVWVAVVSLGLIAVMVGVGVALDGDNGAPESERGAGAAADGAGREDRGSRLVDAPGVAVALEATGEVWVCLTSIDGEELIDGQILEPGATEGPFRAEGFSAVRMTAATAASSARANA